MPNHCCNTLYIDEDVLPEIVSKYIRKNEQDENIFDFDLVVSICDTTDWYNQRIEKWGTKWIGYDLNIGASCIDFYTAWSPPIQIIKKLAELHPDVLFRLEYYELGLAFRGYVTAIWQDDELVFEDKYWDITDEDYEEMGLLDFVTACN